jgi:outer membrane protein OmpA-like peptidoglycan-associated protein
MLNSARLTLSLLLFLSQLRAQNLVLNPSFEQLKPNAIVVPCEFMQASTFFGEKAEVWSTFPDMTPDVLRAAENCHFMQAAHSGEFCLGIIHYLPGEDVGQQKGDYHEVVHGRLSAPLKPGRKYRVEVWVREDSAIIRDHLAKVYSPKTPVEPVKAGNLGFAFTVLRQQNVRGGFWRLVEDGVLRPQVNFSDIIATDGVWSKLSATFVPDQPFQHFIVGNFFRDKQTANNLSAEQHRRIEEQNAATKVPIDRTKRAGYLCIDDVSVTLEPEPDAPMLTMEKQLLQERRFTFSAGVLFDFDKADLRPEAGAELDSLVIFLKKYPKTELGIAGHTDDIGSEEYNLDLSERRAKAVFDYLISKEIPAERLGSRGFGERRPVADNTTEEGRQKNRRVECVLLKQ